MKLIFFLIGLHLCFSVRQVHRMFALLFPILKFRAQVTLHALHKIVLLCIDYKDGHKLVHKLKCGQNQGCLGVPRPMFGEGAFPKHLTDFCPVWLFGLFKRLQAISPGPSRKKWNGWVKWLSATSAQQLMGPPACSHFTEEVKLTIEMPLNPSVLLLPTLKQGKWNRWLIPLFSSSLSRPWSGERGIWNGQFRAFLDWFRAVPNPESEFLGLCLSLIEYSTGARRMKGKDPLGKTFRF